MALTKFHVKVSNKRYKDKIKKLTDKVRKRKIPKSVLVNVCALGLQARDSFPLLFVLEPAVACCAILRPCRCASIFHARGFFDVCFS